MESDIKGVSEIFNKMPKLDWEQAEHVGVSFFLIVILVIWGIVILYYQ